MSPFGAECQQIVDRIGKDASLLPQKLISPFRHHERDFRIHRILLVGSAYDCFILEEEGRLRDMFKRMYTKWDMGYIPQVTPVGTGEEALRRIEEGGFDLLVMFNKPVDMDPMDLGAAVRSHNRDIPIVLLMNNTPELKRLVRHGRAGQLDWIFTWNGDGNIFPTLVQLVEDTKSLEQAPSGASNGWILLAEGDVGAYSSLLQFIHHRMWEHTTSILSEEIPPLRRSYRLDNRPRVLLARDRKELFDRCGMMGRNGMLVIVGNGLPSPPGTEPSSSIERKSNGDDTADDSRSGDGANLSGNNCPDDILPGIWKSCPNAAVYCNGGLFRPVSQQEGDVIELDPSTPSVKELGSGNGASMGDALDNVLGMTDMTFRNENGDEVGRAKDLRELEKTVWTLEILALKSAIDNGSIARWLKGRCEPSLARDVQDLSNGKTVPDDLRGDLLKIINSHSRRFREGTICRFDRELSSSKHMFRRIGDGALGGKARALAFLDKLITQYIPPDLFNGVEISIPKSVVICTDVYETFLRHNGFSSLLNDPPSDEALTKAFLRGDLPATILGDVRALATEFSGPVVVRSSSLLEDALFQPFAGVYSSVMLPGGSTDRQERFRDLSNAVKFVYASTLFKKARDYLKATPSAGQEEKMALLVQEVVGQAHGERFYPTLSGVARSYDYYPMGKCSREDGVCNLALGLGKTIVDGGASFRFCPVHPSTPHWGSLDDLLDISQKSFYAVDLTSRTSIVHQEEDSCLVRPGTDIAMEDGTLGLVASTYSPQDDRLYPTVARDGPKVVDFGPILKLKSFPLPDMVRLLLDICSKALGCPVEIEFAVVMDTKQRVPVRFSLLQVRSMVMLDSSCRFDLEGPFPKNALVCSSRALGNGQWDDLTDVVLVKPDGFDLANTQRMVKQIRDINSDLLKEGRHYLLIGPGRWGSSDPWLGIPVVWSDINGAGVIVETPVGQRAIDPSEGSHFFQNMTSLRVGYMTVTGDDRMDWDRLVNMEVVRETEDILHVRSGPLNITIDGHSGRGIVMEGM